MLQVRNGNISDIKRIMEIYSYARAYMITSGNPTQWGNSYPNRELIEMDIKKGLCRVIYDEKNIHGVFALFEGEDPTYGYIEGGKWLNSKDYVTIHRIAGDGEVHGIFKCAFEYSKKIIENIRIDTHINNKAMQSRLEENGFIACGTIYVEDGSSRLAYQWTK